MSNDGTTYQVGESDTRPWGSWKVIAVGEGYISKEICVMPQQKLSLQRHQHRNEHWIMVSGEAQVTLDEQLLNVAADESVYIPKQTKHRIENVGSEPLIFVEIQTGKVLDENDIERFDDIYGRTQ